MKPADNTSRRGKGGVGIVLSNAAVDAWREAGSVIYNDFDDRILVIRMLVKDLSNRDIGVHLVSAYAPIGTADSNLWDTFLKNMEKCIECKRVSDILVIGWDCNSSMGTNNKSRGVGNIMQSIGRFGIKHQNNAGVCFSRN